MHRDGHATARLRRPTTPVSLHRGRPLRAAGLRVLAGGAREDRLDAGRRPLQLALGLVWLLDAALQYQPFMFGRGFADDVLAPAAAGNPAPVTRSVLWAAHLVAAHPVLWNSLFATAQLLLALGLLWRPTVRLALAASIAWSLSVWWLGEGLGGLLAGSASPLTGAPGAVLLYALLALLAWPGRRTGSSVAGSSVLGRAAPAAWLALWGGEAYLALRPANATGSALHDQLAGGAAGEPAWLGAIDRWAADAAGRHGAATAATLAALLALAAVAVFLPSPLARPLLAATAALALVLWLVAQDLGGLLTGRATDPNTGLLLLLLVWAYLPRRGRKVVRGAPALRLAA